MLLSSNDVERFRVDEGMPIHNKNFSSSEADLDKTLDEVRSQQKD